MFPLYSCRRLCSTRLASSVDWSFAAVKPSVFWVLLKASDNSLTSADRTRWTCSKTYEFDYVVGVFQTDRGKRVNSKDDEKEIVCAGTERASHALQISPKKQRNAAVTGFVRSEQNRRETSNQHQDLAMHLLANLALLAGSVLPQWRRLNHTILLKRPIAH